MTPRGCLRAGGFHDRGERRPPALLHQSRRAGVRAREPPGGREGGPVRALQPQPEEPAASVPRRVRRRSRRRRRSVDRRHGRPRTGRGAVREGVLRVRRRLRRPVGRRAPGVRAGVERADQGARVGPPDELPRAEHAVHRVRLPSRRALPLLPRPARAVEPLRHPLRRRHGPHLRRLQLVGRGRDRPRAHDDSAARRRQRVRVPASDAGQGTRCHPRHPAGGVDVERRDLRHWPGVRDDVAADARPSAPGGAGATPS